MKKVISLFFTAILISTTSAQTTHKFTKNKYSTELDCNYPLTYNVQSYFISQEQILDLEKYKTIIRNGDISAIEKPYLDDLQLGTLSKTELKIFRNMFYAKKGFIFKDEELTKYFMQFDWYEPKTKDVSFTPQEENAINRIKIFEADSTIQYPFEGSTVIWNYFNGGANQRAQVLKLNGNNTFEYTPWETYSRLVKITGKWTIQNNKIILLAQNEEVLLGGYADDGDSPNLKNGSPVTITYQTPVKISLPINESKTYKEYKFDWGKNWISIGSCDCYIK